MKDLQEIAPKVGTLIQEGQSEEEIFQYLSPFLNADSETVEKVSEQLANLPHEVTVRILQRMLERVEEKRIRKTIKRSLYRLKSKGIPVGEISQDKGRSILRPLQVEPPEGYGTALDPLGQRLLILVIPHAGRGVTVLHGVTSDIQGLVNFVGAEMTRREFRGFFENLQKESPLPLAEMEVPYVGFLFVQAYRLTLEKKGMPPQDYLHRKNEIERVKKEYEKPLIYTYLPKEEVEDDERWLRRGADLLRDEPFAAWSVEEDKIKPYAESLQEAQESKLFLNKSQREVRGQEIYLKAMTEIFSEENKRLYQHRLEETAYVLYRLGKEEEAKISLGVAIDLEKPLNPIQPNAFLFQLVVKSIYNLLAEAQEEKGKENSLIIKP